MVGSRGGRRRLPVPVILLIVLLALAIFVYGIIAALSEDLLWFQGGTVLPHPARIVIRVDGQTTILSRGSPGYDAMVQAARDALSRFDNWAPISAGLSQATLEEYQHSGAILELYFDEPVDFRQPFSDGQPTALLIPIQGRQAAKRYVLRGKDGKWWSGAMVMHDPGPLLNTLSALGYVP
jgi:hypothetical protein